MKFSFMYSNMETLSENPLKDLFSFHLASVTYLAIIHPAKMNWKLIKVGKMPVDQKHNCFLLLFIPSLRD